MLQVLLPISRGMFLVVLKKYLWYGQVTGLIYMSGTVEVKVIVINFYQAIMNFKFVENCNLNNKKVVNICFN